MNSPTTEADAEERSYANITVSEEYRDELRVAKAEAGLSYEEFLRQHVSLDTE